MALSKRGHDGEAYGRDGEIHARAVVDDTALGLDITIVGKHPMVRQHGYLRPAPDLPATTPMMLRLDPGFDRKYGEAWKDDADGSLESKIAAIAAPTIVAGEAKFRKSLREAEERAERNRLEQEKRRPEKLAELNRQRLQDLRTSGELLRQAQDIRALVESVRQATLADPTKVDVSILKAW